MTEVYTIIYHTGILTEYCEKWDDCPNVDKMWAKFQTHFTDVQQNMRRMQKQTAKQTGLHGAKTVLTDELERANDALINMAQTAMTEK